MSAGQNKAGSLWNGSAAGSLWNGSPCPGQAAKGHSAEEM